MGGTIAPNELADWYDALQTLYEHLPSTTHPAWQQTLDAVLFGGEELADDATSYGRQQADRNSFTMSVYRRQYGDGERVKEHPAIETGPPRAEDRQYTSDSCELPVAPESGTVLPIEVSEATIADALSLLAEFPGEPAATAGPRRNTPLIDPPQEAAVSTSPNSSPTAAENSTRVDPNELADLYAVFSQLLSAAADKAHPAWTTALETIVYGNEYLRPDASSYGHQQAERNEMAITTYRETYGDGHRVTEFPSITTRRSPEENSAESPVYRPVVPGTDDAVPVEPAAEHIREWLELLLNFPSEPQADTLPSQRSSTGLFDLEGLCADFGLTPDDENEVPTETIDSESDGNDGAVDDDIDLVSGDDSPDEATAKSSATDTGTQTNDTNSATDSDNSRVIRSEGPGESQLAGEPSLGGETDDRKYEDPEAERSHREAQRRNPADVVELGEEITLVLSEVDRSSRPPTILGRRNRLVIFVEEVPQDVTVYDTIRAKITDYGGKNQSATAVFAGYP